MGISLIRKIKRNEESGYGGEVMRLDSLGTSTYETRPRMHEIGQKMQEQVIKEEHQKRNIAEYVQQNPGYCPTVAEKVVIQAIEEANMKLRGVNAEFEFSIHEQTKQIMVKVLNAETKEVIREIPPEKILDMVAHIWELAGIFVDERR